MNVFVYSRVPGLGGNYPALPRPPVSQPLITGFIVQSRSLKASGLKHFPLWRSLSFACEHIRTYYSFVINFQSNKPLIRKRPPPPPTPTPPKTDPPLFLRKRLKTFQAVKLGCPAAARRNSFGVLQRSLWRRAEWARERESERPAGGQSTGLQHCQDESRSTANLRIGGRRGVKGGGGD